MLPLFVHLKHFTCRVFIRNCVPFIWAPLRPHTHTHWKFEETLTRNDDVTDVLVIRCRVIHLDGCVGNGCEQTEGLPMLHQNGGGRRRRRRVGSVGGGPPPRVSPPIAVEAGRMVLFQFALQVADVVDDVLDHFQFGYFAVLGHVRHQLFQFGQVHLDFHLLFGGHHSA